MSDYRYMDAAEVAKIIRRVLKEAFPGQKFSVRTDKYSMGASVDVRWTDGPLTKDVDALMRVFESKRFNGQDDSSRYVHHIYEGEEVCFGSNYVMTARSISDDLRDRAAAALNELRNKPEELARFLATRSHKGDLDRDFEYLTFHLAQTMTDVEPKGSPTVTAILLANPFLYEEAA